MDEQRIKLRIVKSPLPPSVHGLSAKDGDTFIILINGSDGQNEQEKTFIHEMLHIWHGDHDRSPEELQALEAQRHRTTEQFIKSKLT